MSQIVVPCPSCGTKNRIPEEKQHLQPRCGRCGQILARIGTVLTLDDSGFERLVRESTLPVLVDFYSPTCGPCQMLAPVIEAVAAKKAGRLLVAKLDTSRHHLAASRFQIRGVPTLLFFRNGKVVDQIVGAVPQAELEQHIRALL